MKSPKRLALLLTTVTMFFTLTACSSQPIAPAPSTSEPTASAPASSEPDASAPASSTPAPSVSASSTPASSEPVASVPVSSAPVSSEPAASVPASSTPSAPASSEPAASTPASSVPANSDSEANSTVKEPETVLIDQNGVKIIRIGNLYRTSSSTGPQLKVRIENNSAYNITAQTRKTSVNGYTLGDFGSSMYIDVASGEKAYGTLTIVDRNLKEAGITTIETLTVTFNIYDSDQWGKLLFNTNSVTIKF
ncbi:MAG: hypothetical protein PUF15_08885 [Faecalibacterium prausnitzii]|nr:hypothetical protein [Faecalibacterium prausnitzii]